MPRAVLPRDAGPVTSGSKGRAPVEGAGEFAPSVVDATSSLSPLLAQSSESCLLGVSRDRACSI